jgi:hypothetical protein
LFILLVSLTTALVSSAADETLTDASIIELQGLNLGDAVIIEKIQTSKCNFDTSIDGLKALKAANVSGVVIQAMLAKSSGSGTMAGNSAPANSNDPADSHSPGIWILQETNGVKTMTKVGWETPAEISHGGYIGPFGIGKYSTTARFTGTQSALELSQTKPEFYLYTGGTSYDDLMVESPNELTLAQFTVIAPDAKRNANQRAVDVGTTGAYASSHGIDRKAVREFDSEKIADGIYKITPHDNLADGEYGFCSSDSARMYGGIRQKFYTFGIHSK